MCACPGAKAGATAESIDLKRSGYSGERSAGLEGSGEDLLVDDVIAVRRAVEKIPAGARHRVGQQQSFLIGRRVRGHRCLFPWLVGGKSIESNHARQRADRVRGGMLG